MKMIEMDMSCRRYGMGDSCDFTVPKNLASKLAAARKKGMWSVTG